MRTGTYLGILLSFMVSLQSFASPNSFTYQGRILKTDGNPLEYNNVSFAFEITNASGSCVLYREQRDNINMQGSKGVFDVPIGSGTRLYPTGPSYDLRDAFNNAITHSCEGGASYVAHVDDIRILKVQFHDGSGWKAISPNNEIRSVPFSTFSYSAAKLADKTANDFVLKNSLQTCSVGQYLTFDGTSFACQNDAGGAGMVSDINVTAPYLIKSGIASLPTITANVGTTAGTLAKGDDPRFTDARTPTGAAGGDLGGNFPSPDVVKLRGKDISPTAPTLGQFLKFDGVQWLGAAISMSDVVNLNSSLSSYVTQSAFNTVVATGNCLPHQTMYWNSVSSNFQCQSINVSLAGDVSGTIGATSVDRIKGVAIDSTSPTSGQVLKFDGTKWTPGALPTASLPAFTGDVSSAAGSTTLTLANTAVTPGSYGSTTSVGTFTVDSKGRITTAASTAIAFPVTSVASKTGAVVLDATDISSAAGKYLTLKPNNIACTDGQVLKWVAVNTRWECANDTDTSSGGTISSLTGDVTASGTGAVTATVASVGGVTAANVASGANLANGATNLNTASTLVKRDASGNFTAGTITANLTGAASSNVLKAGDTMTGDLFMDNQRSVKFKETTGNGSNFVALQAPAALTADLTFRLPAVDGSANQVLKTDGTGNLGWATVGVGSVTSVSSSNGDISIATGTTTPVLTLNSGTAGGAGDASKIAKLDASGLLAVNMIPNISAAKITSGVLPIANGGTNSSAVLNNNRMMISSGSAIVENAAITANRAIASNLSGLPVASATTDVELGYLSGVTSSVQSQLNGKSSSTGWANYSVIGTNGSGTMTAITGATSGTILQYSVTGPVYSTATYPSSTTANQLLYSSSNNVVGGLATVNNAVLTTNGSGIPSWSVLSNDSFTQYALLAGRAGGQILNGGTAAGNSLTLDSTAHATKGNVLINPTGGKVGIGTGSPSRTLDVAGTTGVSLYASGATNTGSSSSTNWIRSPKNSVTLFVGDNDVTTSYVANDFSSDIRFNGTGPNWGDLSFYPTGGGNGNYGNFRLSLAGTAVSTTPNAKLGVGDLYAGGSLGVGTTTPATDLEVVDATGAGLRGITSTTYATNPGGVLQTRGARGTASAPLTLNAADSFGWLAFSGYDGSTFSNQALPTGLNAQTSQVWTSTAHGSNLRFITTPDNTTAGLERMRIDQAGNVGIGLTSPITTLSVAALNTGLTTDQSNLGISVYGSSNDYGGITLWDRDGNTGTTNDGDTTIYWGDDVQENLRFAFKLSGAALSEKMRITSTGLVGIGTTTPASMLEVGSSNGTVGLDWDDPAYGMMVNTNVASAWARESSFAYNGSKLGSFGAYANSGTLNYMYINANQAGAASGHVSPEMVILPSGNVGIGTISPGYKLHVVGTAGLSTGTAWTLASDARLKDIHGDYEYGLNEILKLHTVRFNYKKDNALNIPSDKAMTGFIAQEVQKVIPDAVHTREDGYLELNADPIHWATVNSIKELYGMCKATDHKIEANTTEITQLKRKVASIESENAKLKERADKSEKENAELKDRLNRIEKALGLIH